MMRNSSLFIALYFLNSVSYGQICATNIPQNAGVNQFTLLLNHAIDNRTGLNWARCSLGQKYNSLSNTCDGQATLYTWREALIAVKLLNDTGGIDTKTDWRLPNNKELWSIVEYACYDPAINITVFPNTSISQYWSSTTYSLLENNAWAPHFHEGIQYTANKTAERFPIRLVRGGQ